MQDYEGSCHCGAIGYVYSCPTPPAEWSVRACQCGFCRGHAALSTSGPRATIEFTAKDPADIGRYRFGLRTADFLLCLRCGVYIGATIKTPQGRFGIINTRALVKPPPDLAVAEPISYDGEDTAGRVSRREQRWSAVTDFPQ